MIFLSECKQKFEVSRESKIFCLSGRCSSIKFANAEVIAKVRCRRIAVAKEDFFILKQFGACNFVYLVQYEKLKHLIKLVWVFTCFTKPYGKD
jgi:hypothetical protein